MLATSREAQDNDGSHFAFERAVFRKLWLLLGGATFTLIGFFWLLTQWGRSSLLETEGVAAVVLFYFAARTAWNDERRSRLTEHSALIALETQMQRPQRTPAEQHDYEIAVKAVKLVGEKGLIALRHLRRHGTLTYALGIGGGSPLAPGIRFDEMIWAYNHCVSEGLITCSEKPGSGVRTFSISPKMEKILDDVLYENHETPVDSNPPLK